jgi:competence/damage-inducible protein CinA-like protein
MPAAELIAIGTELLLGEIVDTNTRFIARQLRDIGVDLFRSTTIGDNLERITSLIKESCQRADIIITTGGLGPTVDDPTRDAAATAFGLQNEFHPELWTEIQQRFLKRSIPISENNRKQAYIPAGAIVIRNPVGTAPAFILNQGDKTLICLPGVPREMETLLLSAILPWLKQHYNLNGIIKARVLHTVGVPESRVDELIADLEVLSNPSVGLLAHPGIVDIRITAKADSEAVADEMILKIESEIKNRLGKDIFGYDGETLTSTIRRLSAQLGNPPSLQIEGFSPQSEKAFIDTALLITPGNSVFAPNLTPSTGAIIDHYICQFFDTKPVAKVQVTHINTRGTHVYTREFQGAPGLKEVWALNFALGTIFHQIQLTINAEETDEQR